MHKNVAIGLSAAVLFLVAGCMLVVQEMDSYRFHHLAVIRYPKNWYVDVGSEIVWFSPVPRRETDDPLPMQFAVGNASISEFFIGFDPIDPLRLQAFIIDMRLDLLGEVRIASVDDRPAFVQEYRDTEGVFFDGARGWFAIAGREDSPVLVVVIATPGGWRQYGNTVDLMFRQMTFD